MVCGTTQLHLAYFLIPLLSYLFTTIAAFRPPASPWHGRSFLTLPRAVADRNVPASSGEEIWKSKYGTTSAAASRPRSSFPPAAHHFSASPDRRRSGRNDRSKKEWERSAPEEFLLILTRLRAEENSGRAPLLDEETERDIGHVIKLVRALANRQWEQAEESAALLCRSPLLDTVLSRMVVYAATQRNEPDLALEILGGMREKRIDVDAFMASLVAKAAATDRRWMPVVEVIRAQLSSNPGGDLIMPGTPQGRRHGGFTQALASTIERGKFYSSSFLVDALLQFRMVDLFTAKVALKFYRFSRTPARGLPWITTARAIGLIPDADLDFEVGRVYKSLGMWREAVALLSEMVEQKRAVEDEHVGVVLSACHQAGEWKECLATLSKMREWGLSVGRVSYLIVLRLLLEKRRLDQVRSVLQQMEAQGSPLDAETARLALFTLAKRGPVYSSLEFLKLMPVFGVEPDLVSYTAVIRACARFQQPDLALEVLTLMAKNGMAPDVLACATAMDALSGAARWDEAFALFDGCRSQGLRPDIKCWTQVLGMATQAGRWDLFPAYLEAAVGEARVHKTGLDLRFFATVINACAEGNRTDEALAVLASVRSYGLMPNVVCFTAAAKACLARRRWRDALGLLEEAQKEGVPADATLYRTVLGCCWRARQWQSVLKLYGEMLERGLEVDSRMYTSLMDALAGAGQSELAANVLQDMVANGIAPVDATWSAFFQSWYHKGEYGTPWKLIEELVRWEDEGGMDSNAAWMPRKVIVSDADQRRPSADGSRAGSRQGPRAGLGTGPGPRTLADLMHVCARREDWGEVLELQRRITDMGLPPTATRAPHLVVRAYAELGRWTEAQQFLCDCMHQGVSTESTQNYTSHDERASDQARQVPATENSRPFSVSWSRTYGALLTLCSKRIEPVRALALLKDMEDKQLAPDAEAYHAVMDACAQAGMKGEVRMVFEKLRARADLLPRVESFTIMLDLCAREGGKGEEALRLMDDLEGLGLTPDMLCFNAAMEACREASMLETDPGEGRYRRAMRKWRDVEVMHTYNSEMAVLATRKGGQDGEASSTALRYLREMQANGIPRDTDSFNMALEACARGGNLQEARTVFEELQAAATEEAQGPSARPDIFSYITLANALAKDGRDSEAMAWLNHMVGLAVDEAKAVVGAAPNKTKGRTNAGRKAIQPSGNSERLGMNKSSTSRVGTNILLADETPALPSPSTPIGDLEEADGFTPSSLLHLSSASIRKKTRWPAYYRNLWPQTVKTLSKNILVLARCASPREQATRCADIGKLLEFLDSHVPILNTQVVAEQLVGMGICSTKHIKTLTGNALKMRWRENQV